MYRARFGSAAESPRIAAASAFSGNKIQWNQAMPIS
jgi:hypothetical protein